MNRVGIGYDVHRFKEGRRLVIGGVEIPHDKGLDGHSDADVLARAAREAPSLLSASSSAAAMWTANAATASCRPRSTSRPSWTRTVQGLPLTSTAEGS